MKLTGIRMPYSYFDLVIGEEFKDQGGMILEDTQIAFDKADRLRKRAFSRASRAAFTELRRSRHRRREQGSLSHPA